MNKNTQTEIAKDYDVRNGIIKSPGKFEGEPILTLYYYDAFLNGDGDSIDEDSNDLAFNVTAEEAEAFGLTVGDRVTLTFSDQGFVGHYIN